MHVKVDEDLPRSVVDLLRAEGYHATSVREQGLQGTKDSALWQVVQQEGCFLLRLTRDSAIFVCIHLVLITVYCSCARMWRVLPRIRSFFALCYAPLVCRI